MILNSYNIVMFIDHIVGINHLTWIFDHDRGPNHVSDSIRIVMFSFDLGFLDLFGGSLQAMLHAAIASEIGVLYLLMEFHLETPVLVQGMLVKEVSLIQEISIQLFPHIHRYVLNHALVQRKLVKSRHPEFEVC